MKLKPVIKNLKISAKARYDLIQIGKYTESKWGRNQRNHYLKQLDQAIKLIGANSMIGKNRAYVLPGYRSLQQGSHVIYYREFEEIEIIRILHKQMDVEKHIQKT